MPDAVEQRVNELSLHGFRILLYPISHILMGHGELSDYVKGLLPTIIRDAGFDNVEEKARCMTLFGTLYLYRAQKPYYVLDKSV